MNIEHLKDNGIDIAVVSGDEVVIVDTQSALDLAMTVKYETGAERIVIDKDVDVSERQRMDQDVLYFWGGWEVL